MFRSGAGASSSGLHTRQTGRPTTRARGGGWGASGLSEGIGGGRGGGSEGPRGALGRAPGDYTHDSRAGRRHARGAGRDACGPGRPTRRGGGRNGWRGGRRQEHRPNGPHGARPYVPDRAPLSPRSARAPQPPTYARGGGRNGWRGGRPEQHSPSARAEHRCHAENKRGGGGPGGAHERNPDRCQAVHGPPRGKQRPSARQTAVYSQHPRKPFTSRIAANSDPPRGKQPFTAIIPASRSRPTSRQTTPSRAANSDPPTSRVPRSFRARCALAARCARRARRGRDAFGGTSIGLPIGKMVGETI